MSPKTTLRHAFAMAGSLSLLGSAAVAAEPEEVLPPFVVAPSNLGTFHQPVAVFDGSVYTANVEPAEGVANGMNLRTVVRHGRRGTDQTWQWSKTVLEPRTLDDPWHTIPSIAVDRSGRIHVAYNMHNMPWQYAVTALPGDISSFEFRGDLLTDETLAAVKFRNETPFPKLGSAAIPGTGITYASFFTDRHDDLWITYRQALRPRRDWRDRIYGCGIARYDPDQRNWTAIGGTLDLEPGDADVSAAHGERPRVIAFCAALHWWALDILLDFDRTDTMHVVWTWSDYLHGTEAKKRVDRNVYAVSHDGGRTFTSTDNRPSPLPIEFERAERYVAGDDHYPARSMTTDATGAPVIAVQRYGESHKIVRYDRATSTWTAPELSPAGAGTLINDRHGTIWAFASGPTVFRSPETPPFVWEKVHEETGWGQPRVVFAPRDGMFYLHVVRCDGWARATGPKAPTGGACTAKIERIAID